MLQGPSEFVASRRSASECHAIAFTGAHKTIGRDQRSHSGPGNTLLRTKGDCCRRYRYIPSIFDPYLPWTSQSSRIHSDVWLNLRKVPEPSARIVEPGTASSSKRRERCLRSRVADTVCSTCSRIHRMLRS